MEAFRLYAVGFLLLFAGLILLFLGSATSASSASFGGVVFIGPFPIVFGSGPGGATLALISIVVAVAMILVLYLSILANKKWAPSS
jgi:uncharacterized protein (TIGR00304 family)